MLKRLFFTATLLLCTAAALSGQDFKIGPEGYFQQEGVNVMVFDDYYPEGHQSGICIIMNGNRVASNGDLRFEATPGQWQPAPKRISRKIDGNTISATLAFPDSSRHLTGKNPMVYPDAVIQYTVTAKSVGDHIEIVLVLDKPIPDAFIGKAGFNLELFPGSLFGKPWIMDEFFGLYPTQPNGPLQVSEPNYKHTGDFYQQGRPKIDFDRLIAEGEGYNPIVADDIIGEPYAVGRKFTSRPDDPYSKFTIETLGPDLKLYDGRMNHNNGWFVLRSEIPAGATKEAVRWIIRPNIVPGWRYAPVVQASQVGYHPLRSKVAILEMDSRDSANSPAEILRIDADGESTVLQVEPKPWGRFLRYNYAKIDFSEIHKRGLYRIRYKDSSSSIFRIADDVYDRGVWQPVVEYFLPNQMCHMRVSEKYRVWHGACHLDDARMALNESGFDRYVQEPGLSPYAPGEPVPELATGGWHDAGDLDLRIESQAGESYILSMIYDQFRPEIDVTSIDFINKVTEIHEPDGRNDILQQVENGALSVVAAHNALGRPYRGIIASKLRQYVIMGDASTQTDGISGTADDRWVYTENNPARDLGTAAHLAGVSRMLKGFNDTLSTRCLQIAETLFQTAEGNKLHAAVELYLTTGKAVYRDYILDNKSTVLTDFDANGWFTARVAKSWEKSRNKKEKNFAREFRQAVEKYKEDVDALSAETPYGVPYKPSIWGAGWVIQSFGYRYYFLLSEYPEILPREPIFNALDFILGRHPGSNTESFASGVGAVSATVAYGTNRADWSFIPGGVISGTAIIQPDFPELLKFPFLWQQVEYVMSGGASHYMFLVMAAQRIHY